MLTALSVNESFVLPEDRDWQFPVWFIYDYLGDATKYLCRPSLKLNEQMQIDHCAKEANEKQANGLGTPRVLHAIDVFPLSAGLPWATGILTVRQNKHWKAALQTTIELLEHFAYDPSATRLHRSNGTSFAQIAKHELSDIKESWMKFPVYLFAEVDATRMRLLAAVNVFIFVFDDIWEMNDAETITRIQDDFINQILSSDKSDESTKTKLQTLIDSVIDGIRAQDEICGNGGQDVINRMIQFFSRAPPDADFRTMEQFLEYRREDAAVPYVLACAKFSICSNVDLDTPKLQKFTRLVSDHVSIANDLGSWDKEKQAYDLGKVLYLINAVDVVKRLFNLPTDGSAKAMTYALQLEIECEIDSEVQRLRAEGDLTKEEWKYMEAVFQVMSGNVLVSTIMNRYGGEQTRLPRGT